jgi:integrative and conjugative element protein (TIGR02256 family)
MQSRQLKAPLVLIPRRLLNSIQEQRHCYLPQETGGFLIGLRRSINVEVVDFTMQEREDVATPVSFRRDGPGHAAKVIRAWETSSNLMTVVGDWHSHPWGLGTPSTPDMKAWRTLARASKKPVVGLIAAQGAIRLFWVANRFLSKAIELQVVEDGAGDVTYGLATPQNV